MSLTYTVLLAVHIIHHRSDNDTAGPILEATYHTGLIEAPITPKQIENGKSRTLIQHSI